MLCHCNESMLAITKRNVLIFANCPLCTFCTSALSFTKWTLMCQFSDVNLLWCVEIDICNVQYSSFPEMVRKCVHHTEYLKAFFHSEYLKAFFFRRGRGHKGRQGSFQRGYEKQWLSDKVAVYEWFDCLCGHKWIVVMLQRRKGGRGIYLQCFSSPREPCCQYCFFSTLKLQVLKKKKKRPQPKVILMLSVQLRTKGIPSSLSLPCLDMVV